MMIAGIEIDLDESFRTQSEAREENVTDQENEEQEVHVEETQEQEEEDEVVSNERRTSDITIRAPKSPKLAKL